MVDGYDQEKHPDSAKEGAGDQTRGPSIAAVTDPLHPTHKTEPVKEKWWKQPEHVIQVFVLLFVASYTILTFFLLQTSKDTERRQLRAYVGIDSKTVELKCGSCVPTALRRDTKAFYDDDFVGIGIHNFGQTPAHELTSRSNWKEMPFGAELPKDFDYPDNPPIESAYPMSKSTLNPTESAIAGNQFGAETVAIIIRAREHQASMYIYGHIDYKDVFDKPRTTPFCFRYAPDTTDEAHRFPLCPEHNSPAKDDW